ncbi:hypothetical protein PINS_up024600 [Pythium insidiosum]|nr:hypothetical protein PINS_up017645 [Pythium insidiosum]GLE11853.1 hypothetical protein PINS_up024600 [Pythium insidiosum]
MIAASSNDVDDDTKDNPVAGDEIKAAIDDMVQCATEEGFPLEKVERLSMVIVVFDVWRVKLGTLHLLLSSH